MAGNTPNISKESIVSGEIIWLAHFSVLGSVMVGSKSFNNPNTVKSGEMRPTETVGG